ncbi:hypothetical protein [Weissella hellenica]|uniref:hypothetical protein n=1 Tax=Weissella hellenica TaxID=46256 RepID=UPI00388B1C50
MKDISELQALVIEVIHNPDNYQTISHVVEAETDPLNLIYSLILLGFSQGKDAEQLNKLFSELDDNTLNENGEDIVTRFSDSLITLFK